MSAHINSNPDDRKRGVRRAAIGMSLLAFAIYAGFILMSVLRAGH